MYISFSYKIASYFSIPLYDMMFKFVLWRHVGTVFTIMRYFSQFYVKPVRLISHTWINMTSSISDAGPDSINNYKFLLHFFVSFRKSFFRYYFLESKIKMLDIILVFSRVFNFTLISFRSYLGSFANETCSDSTFSIEAMWSFWIIRGLCTIIYHR